MAKVEQQLSEGLEGLTPEQFGRVIIAYEPIWAIGTGLTATPEQAQEVHVFIREKLAENYGNAVCSCAIILYGGSVKPANTFSLLKKKDINGALVGGAALDSGSFIEIVKEAIRAYKEK
jgi:triosephosphate isomerase